MGGALSLVRGQSRFGLLLVVLLFAAGLDLFYLVSPWKWGDSLATHRVLLPLGGTAAIRHGEEVLVLRAGGSPTSMGSNRVFRLVGSVALPTRWAD